MAEEKRNVYTSLFDKGRQRSSNFNDHGVISQKLWDSGHFRSFCDLFIDICSTESSYLKEKLVKLKSSSIRDINVRNELRANKKIYKDNLKVILNNLVDDIWRDESLLQKRDHKVEKFKKHMKSAAKDKRPVRDRRTIKKQPRQEECRSAEKEARNMQRTQSQFVYSKKNQAEPDSRYFNRKHLQVSKRVKELIYQEKNSKKDTHLVSTKLKCQKRLDFNIVETPGPAFYDTNKDTTGKGVSFARSKKLFMNGRYDRSDAPGPMYKID